MFFRSKRENGRDSSPPVPAKPGKAPPAVPSKASRSNGTGPVGDPAPAAAKPLAPDELKTRAEARRRLAATLGDIVSLMIRSPRHRDRKLSDLRWLALPAIRAGQVGLVTAQSKSQGHSAPIAAILWASVSAEVDKRLSETLDAPMRLGPREWKSGDILWLIDAIGNERAVSVLVRQLHGREWKGRAAKARVKDAKGGVTIRLLGAQAAAGSAAAQTR